MDPPQPIARYHQRAHRDRAQWTLYPEYIHVQRDHMASRVAHAIPLQNCRPTPERRRARRGSWRGAALAGAVAAGAVGLAGLILTEATTALWLALGAGLLAGALAGVSALRPVEHAVFHADDGQELFRVIRHRRFFHDRFDPFVGAICKQIRLVRQSARRQSAA